MNGFHICNYWLPVFYVTMVVLQPAILIEYSHQKKKGGSIMNIADRIQTLRKSRGISQEELADKIGVSRQAVSKWESEQSSPDLEKIILLSDCFDVTTDYLLKGIEPVEDEPKTKADARIFSVLATVLNFIGLLAPVSHLLIALLERKSCSASSFCVYPFSFRSWEMKAPSFSLSISNIIVRLSHLFLSLFYRMRVQ